MSTTLNLVMLASLAIFRWLCHASQRKDPKNEVTQKECEACGQEYFQGQPICKQFTGYGCGKLDNVFHNKVAAFHLFGIKLPQHTNILHHLMQGQRNRANLSCGP